MKRFHAVAFQQIRNVIQSDLNPFMKCLLNIPERRVLMPSSVILNRSAATEQIHQMSRRLTKHLSWIKEMNHRKMIHI